MKRISIFEYQIGAERWLIWIALLLSALALALVVASTAAKGSSLVGWGLNSSGQSTVPAGDDFTAIAGGGQHSLALKLDGSILGWGLNNYGQTNVPAGTFVAIAAGEYHSLALRSDSSLAGWGYNGQGQTDVPADGNFVSIAAGYAHSLGLKINGTLLGWGLNNFGQTTIPPLLTSVVAIAAGGDHSLALKADGTLVGWGRNDYGQTIVPPGLTGVVSIAAGAQHSLALKSDGTIVGWGDNQYGQTNVPLGDDFVAIAAGEYHSLALRQNETLVGWGYNGQGQTNVPQGNSFTVISGGGFHGLAIQQGLSGDYNRDGAVDAADYVLWRKNDGSEQGYTTWRANFGISQCLSPTIERHPQSQTVSVGSDVTFFVEVSGTEPFTYQWSKDGAPIVAATFPSLLIRNVNFADAGDYGVMCANSCGAALSDTASVTVLDGDFNRDGKIDAADYVTWRKNPGGIYALDAYDAWRTNFGRTLFAGNGAAISSAERTIPTVPEPATRVMLFVAALLIGSRRHEAARKPNRR
jgi:alpha-tubulin suppressor-like RCC1 family protein